MTTNKETAKGGTLAEQLKDKGPMRDELPPGPPQKVESKKVESKKQEERPPSVGRAKIDTAFRGLDAGEKTLREVLELQAKVGRLSDATKFAIETADALKVPVQKLHPPTQNKGMEVETVDQMLRRYVETALKGPNPASAIGILRKARNAHFVSGALIDQLSQRVEKALEAKVEDKKVVSLRQEGKGGQSA